MGPLGKVVALLFCQQIRIDSLPSIDGFVALRLCF